jgi:hypothetical protein
LAGNNADVPPVSLVFTGALNKAAEISPAVDTAAIEAYLTMRRMQEGVEQLETLDVSGRTPPSVEAAPEDQTSAVPAEPPANAEATGEAAAPEPPAPAPETPAVAVPQSAPSASLPSATELLGEGPEDEIEPADAAGLPPPIPVAPSAPPSTSAAVDQPAPAKPAPPPSPAPAPAPAPAAAPEGTTPAEPQTEAAVTPEAEPAPPAVEPAPVRPKPAQRRVKKRPVEPPDAWRKSVPLFGGG